MKLSVVLPIYNEAESLRELIPLLLSEMQKIGHTFEIIAVNDGSSDESAQVLNELAKQHSVLKVIHFRTNAGQTSALRAGFSHASGEIIVPLDADLENRPSDIPRLLAKLDEGYDIVSGWRKERWAEQKFIRKLPSTIANKLISSVSNVKLHDYGCTLKAYRSETVKHLRLYGEMHRFIPAYAARAGARVAEIEVAYEPRKFGASKYGFSRTIRVILDLLVMRFFNKYMDRPMQFFGGLGIIFFVLGGLVLVGAITIRFTHGISMIETPLPILSALCAIVAVQLLTMGIIAEMLMRVYFEGQNKSAYFIANKVNF